MADSSDPRAAARRLRGSGTGIMTDALYEPGFVRLHEVLGRTYNNPLGDSPFALLRRLLADRKCPRVLDAGCGRGETACWWARRGGAEVDAFDPSAAMLAAARQMVQRDGLNGRVRLRQADIQGFSAPAAYDLLAHDVLCYSRELRADFERLISWLARGGIASLSGYHGDAQAAETRAVASQWGIQPPPAFGELEAGLPRLGLERLLLVDTTRQYGRHWQAVRDTLAARRAEAERVAGCEETAVFSARIDAILDAVRSGCFGHWWAVLAKAADRAERTAR